MTVAGRLAAIFGAATVDLLVLNLLVVFAVIVLAAGAALATTLVAVLATGALATAFTIVFAGVDFFEVAINVLLNCK